MSFNYPAVNPVFFPTASMPLILASSGTFKHPRPGTKIYVMASAIGGGGGGGGRSSINTDDPDNATALGSGGGGGSGRLARPVFLELIADVVVTIGAGGAGGTNDVNTGAKNGSAGGTTTFSTISASGGSGGTGAGQNSTTGAAGGAGGAGGGGGGGNSATGGNGGNGLDGLAGGGGYHSGVCGLSKNSGFGWNMSLPSTTSTAPTNWKVFTGIPNGGGDKIGGLGGDMSVLFPWVMGRGRGGAGGGQQNTSLESETGYSGAVFLWQMSQSQTGVR